MTIPMVIRIKGLFAMSEDQRKRAMATLEAAYTGAKERGVPLVVGSEVEVLWPVERWEHETELVGNDDHLASLIKEHENKGWQVAALSERRNTIIFKRPARDDEGSSG